MSKSLGKIGQRNILPKRLDMAAAVLIAALMVLTAVPIEFALHTAALAVNAQSFTTDAVPRAPVDLGSAGNFVILAKSGISTTGTTSIVGDIGVSPIDHTAITGFGLVMDSSNQFATSSLVTGNIYAADYAPPTPTVMTTAISDMETAYTNAAGRTLPDHTELGAGNIGGMTLTPGLYKWSSGVTIPTDVTLSGNSNGVWIFQIAQDLDISPATRVILSGGAQGENIFWQVAGQTTLGTTSVFNGNILDQTAIVLNTGATLNGRALAQIAVTLDANTIRGATGSTPDTTPPTVSSTIPTNNVTGVAVNSAMTATFSEAMDPLTITTTTFTLTQGITPVSGTVTYTGVTATFTPEVNLTPSTTYTATITTGATDLASNALANNYTWNFTAGSTTYNVTFNASGLPSGVWWWIDLNGNNQSSTSNVIGFSLPNGTYDYIAGASGYTASLSTGSVIVNGANANEQVTFTTIPEFPSFLILALLMMGTLLTFTVCRKWKNSKTSED